MTINQNFQDKISFYHQPRGMLTVNASPFPAIYDILKKWWYSCGTHHVNQRWLG